MSNINLSMSLKEPFGEEDLIKTLIPDSVLIDEEHGPVGAYATEIATSAIQERLDEVFGVDGWETFVETLIKDDAAGFRCQLKTHYPSGRTITKTGVGVSDTGDVNDALKRAFHSAVRLYGVGRYLDSIDDEWGVVLPEVAEELGIFASHSAEKIQGSPENPALRVSQEQLMEDIPIGCFVTNVDMDFPVEQPSVVVSDRDSVGERLTSFRNLPKAKPTPDYPH